MSDFIEVHRVYSTGGEAETYLLNCYQRKDDEPDENNV